MSYNMGAMNRTSALADDDFVAAFEACQLPEGLPHRAHVRLAWLYVRRFGAAEAAERVAAGILRFAEAEGAAEKFDEALTRGWVAAIAEAAARTPVTDFDAFVRSNPQLLDSRLLGPPRWLEETPDAETTFLDVMRAVPTAVGVVTSHDGHAVHGSTVSSITALSRRPELVLACLQNGSRLLGLITASHAFAVSFLARGQGDVATRFADPSRAEGAGQFRGVPHRGGPTGPVLTEAAAWLECRLWQEYPGGDHAIVVGEVMEAGLTKSHPLLRWDGGWVEGT